MRGAASWPGLTVSLTVVAQRSATVITGGITKDDGIAQANRAAKESSCTLASDYWLPGAYASGSS